MASASTCTTPTPAAPLSPHAPFRRPARTCPTAPVDCSSASGRQGVTAAALGERPTRAVPLVGGGHASALPFRVCRRHVGYGNAPLPPSCDMRVCGGCAGAFECRQRSVCGNPRRQPPLSSVVGTTLRARATRSLALKLRAACARRNTAKAPRGQRKAVESRAHGVR